MQIYFYNDLELLYTCMNQTQTPYAFRMHTGKSNSKNLSASQILRKYFPKMNIFFSIFEKSSRSFLNNFPIALKTYTCLW